MHLIFDLSIFISVVPAFKKLRPLLLFTHFINIVNDQVLPLYKVGFLIIS